MEELDSARQIHESAPGQGNQKQHRMGQNLQFPVLCCLRDFACALSSPWNLSHPPFTHLFLLCLAHTFLNQCQLRLPPALVGVLLLCAAALSRAQCSLRVTVCLLVFLDPVVSFQRAEAVCSHHWIPSWMVRFLERGKC